MTSDNDRHDIGSQSEHKGLPFDHADIQQGGVVFPTVKQFISPRRKRLEFVKVSHRHLKIIEALWHAGEREIMDFLNELLYLNIFCCENHTEEFYRFFRDLKSQGGMLVSVGWRTPEGHEIIEITGLKKEDCDEAMILAQRRPFIHKEGL